MKRLIGFGLPAAALLALAGGCQDQVAPAPRDTTSPPAKTHHDPVAYDRGANSDGSLTPPRPDAEPASKTAARVQVEQKKGSLEQEKKNEQAQDVMAKRDSEAVPGAAPLGNSLRRSVTGTVAKSSSDALELKASDDQSLKLAVDASTKVKIDGQVAQAAQITEGSQVRAAYKTEGDGLKALELEVTSQPAAPR